MSVSEVRSAQISPAASHNSSTQMIEYAQNVCVTFSSDGNLEEVTGNNFLIPDRRILFLPIYKK